MHVLSSVRNLIYRRIPLGQIRLQSILEFWVKIEWLISQFPNLVTPQLSRSFQSSNWKINLQTTRYWYLQGTQTKFNS